MVSKRRAEALSPLGAVPPSPPPPPSPPSPSPPPPSPLPSSSSWTLLSGPEHCTLSDGGACVTTGGGQYTNNERCAVRANAPFLVSATTFATERYYDYLTIGGRTYSGSAGPANVRVAAGDELRWSSDGSVVAQGFTVCAHTTQRTPPSPPPSPPETSSPSPPPPVASPPPSPAPTSSPPSPAALDMEVAGAPYSYRTDGTYEAVGTFNGRPLYQRTDQFGLVWSLYRRSYRLWVLDYNRVDNGWYGTVAFSYDQ